MGRQNSSRVRYFGCSGHRSFPVVCCLSSLAWRVGASGKVVPAGSSLRLAPFQRMEVRAPSVCQGCHNKAPQTGCPATTERYCLSSGGWRFKVKVQEGWILLRALKDNQLCNSDASSVPGAPWPTDASLESSVTWPSSYRDASHIGLRTCLTPVQPHLN